MKKESKKTRGERAREEVSRSKDKALVYGAKDESSNLS